MPNRVAQVQKEVLAKFKRVSNLWVAYFNSGAAPEEFGREFWHAVGDILQGKPINALELFHIDPNSVEDVIMHGRERNGKGKKSTTHRKPSILAGRKVIVRSRKR